MRANREGPELDSIDWDRTADYWTVAGGVVAVLTIIYAVLRWWQNRRKRRIADRLGEFLREGQEFIPRPALFPLKVNEHNEWVTRVEAYLTEHLGAAYAVRFSDFSGMRFMGDGSGRSKLRNSIDGRSQRLHEFIAEITKD